MRDRPISRQRGGMTAPTNDQLRRLAIDLAAAAAAEMVLARVAHRLKHGRAHPSRRYVRRAAGAILSELLAEGMSDLYLQRRRLRAEVDRRIVSAQVEAHHAKRARARVPAQRSAPIQETTPAVAQSLGIS